MSKNQSYEQEKLDYQESTEQVVKEKKPVDIKQRILTIVGICLCAILLPILILNVVLIIKGASNPSDVPDIGGIHPLIVTQESMEPTINGGDIIFVKDINPDDLVVGDIISFYDPKGSGVTVVTHKIIGKTVDEDGVIWFETKGDGNNSADPFPVCEDDVIGIYTGRVALLGHIALFMQSTPGLIVCIFLPLATFIGYDVIRRRMYDKQKEDDTKALLAELAELKALKEQKEKE